MQAAVVGAGPAGLAAAEVLAAGGACVTVFERMPSPARKFLLAGNGGLNITHSEPLQQMLPRLGAVAWAVQAWPPAALRDWAADLGQPCFVGTSGRVFPAAFKATPLLRAWLARLDGLGVRLAVRHRWVGWEGEALRFEAPDGERVVRADVSVLAVGGASWPRLGADGSWVGLLEDVAPLRAANAGFLCDWSAPFRARFAGEPLKRIAARVPGDAWVRGEAVVTVRGIEGGVVYALGAALRAALAAHGAAVLELDLRPDLDRGAVGRRLGGPGVSTANALRRAGVAGAAAGLVREVEGLPLVERIKALPLRLVGSEGMERAISAAGGLRFSALDGLMLRDRPGVFAAGEMLDWEAPTGGYLLQGCLSTGRAAGREALDWWAGRDRGRPGSRPPSCSGLTRA